LHLDAVYKATCVVLTGLDDLQWPESGDLYARDKFDFLKPGQLKLATQSWLSFTPVKFRELVAKCGDRALLWSNRPERMFGNQIDRDAFSCRQMEAFIAMMVGNKHGQNYDDVIPRGGGGCFPASAIVRLQDGRTKPVSALHIGDQVLTSQGYSSHYVMSHQARHAVADMVTVSTATGHSVTATPDHYIVLPGCSYKEMRLVTPGDEIMVEVGGGLRTSVVLSTSKVVAEGLYSPITLKGDIIVNGVAMSCWSEWFLEGVLPEVVVPKVYQAIFGPLRLLYKVLPKAFERFAAKFEDDPVALEKQLGKVVLHAAAAISSSVVELFFFPSKTGV